MNHHISKASMRRWSALFSVHPTHPGHPSLIPAASMPSAFRYTCASVLELDACGLGLVSVLDHVVLITSSGIRRSVVKSEGSGSVRSSHQTVSDYTLR